VRKIFGFILIGMALYFARHLLSPRLVSIGYALIALAGGVYLGWIDRVPGAGRGFRALKIAVGVAGIALAAAFLLVPAFRGDTGGKTAGLAWRPFSEKALAEAAREGTPVVLDFTAAWCVLCHELDVKTFNDPAVVKLSSAIVLLRIDFTKPGPVEKKMKNYYLIPGFPTIIFIDRTGTEMKHLRATGLIGPEEFMKRVTELSGTKAEG